MLLLVQSKFISWIMLHPVLQHPVDVNIFNLWFHLPSYIGVCEPCIGVLLPSLYMGVWFPAPYAGVRLYELKEPSWRRPDEMPIVLCQSWQLRNVPLLIIIKTCNIYHCKVLCNCSFNTVISYIQMWNLILMWLLLRNCVTHLYRLSFFWNSLM